MRVGFVSDESYAALADVLLEFRGADGTCAATRSGASGSVEIDLPPGAYEVCLARPGFGSKRV
ncbi:MAG TPA: carboxypeptidase regulatory-like domain-containing protein, partial [Gemmataceae bacterium]